ncbi:MAG: 50S ribosomal protein L32 [Planctomycetota bacterium]|nr:50S ribosomal protein L32 [Planctomycetota bacterium]MDA1215222.1 50S ribosomal protein L32 [Planctomycetota bacterium]
MAVPKRRSSKSTIRQRKSHNAIKPTELAHCPQCGTKVPTHVLCPNCGFYQGRTLVEIED